MHKFYLGQAVAYRAARGLYVAAGGYIVTAKLPERDGEYEYRIRNLAEAHERMARESQLQAMSENEAEREAANRKACQIAYCETIGEPPPPQSMRNFRG
jgi:hypothetical protein